MKVLMTEKQLRELINKIGNMNDMKHSFNTKNQNLNDNDTLYVMLNEVVQDYRPRIRLTEDFMEKVLREYSPIEEGDTVFTGTINDWGKFIGLIIDRYEDLKNEND